MKKLGGSILEVVVRRGSTEYSFDSLDNRCKVTTKDNPVYKNAKTLAGERISNM